MFPSCLQRCRVVTGAVTVRCPRLAPSRLASNSTGAESTELQESERPTGKELNRVQTDVSGLRPWHHRKYHGLPPEQDEDLPHLSSLRVQRRLWALYGQRSGVSPAVAWPVKEEWDDKMEYEALAYPDTLQQMVEKFRAEESAKQAAIDERMQSIEQKMVNLEKWKKEIIDKKNKKEKELRLAQEKRDRMIAEVKEIVGFRVDPRDEKFKELLEEKEKEEKRMLKEAKKKEKHLKTVERLRKMSEAAATDSSTPDKNEGVNS